MTNTAAIRQKKSGRRSCREYLIWPMLRWYVRSKGSWKSRKKKQGRLHRGAPTWSGRQRGAAPIICILPMNCKKPFFNTSNRFDSGPLRSGESCSRRYIHLTYRSSPGNRAHGSVAQLAEQGFSSFHRSGFESRRIHYPVQGKVPGSRGARQPTEPGRSHDNPSHPLPELRSA